MFHVDRAVAVSAFFLSKAAGKGIERMKLAKLQFLAERAAILEIGSPTVGDKPVSLEHGPCLSRSLDLLRGKRYDQLWEKHIGSHSNSPSSKQANLHFLRVPFDFTEVLSEAEIEILENLWSRFGSCSAIQIRDWCHKNIPEYRHVKRAMAPIPLERMLEAAGASEEDARTRAAEIRYFERIEDRPDRWSASVA